MLALKNDSARKELLDLIQENFDKKNETYERVDLGTLMPKLHKLRQKRNKFFPHLFEQTTNLNLQVKFKYF